MKLLKIIILAVFLTLTAQSLLAQDGRYYVHAALGFAYSPSTLKFGVEDIEAGLLGIGTNGGSVGMIKLFREETTFAGFGLAYRYTTAIGFHGTVGKIYNWFPWLRFRIELNGEIYTDNFAQGSGLLGWEVVW